MNKILKKIMSIIVAVALVFSSIVYTNEKPVEASSSFTLSIDWGKIRAIGQQTPYSYSCSCFATAYCRTIAENKIHYWTEFNKNGTSEYNVNCNWGGCKKYTLSSRNAFYNKIYDALNEGKPVIVHVAGNGSTQHYVTVVGYTGFTSRESLSIKNFIMIDPVAPRNKYQTYPLNASYYGSSYYILDNGCFIPNVTYIKGNEPEPPIYNLKVTNISYRGGDVEFDINPRENVKSVKVYAYKESVLGIPGDKWYDSPTSVSNKHYVFRVGTSDFMYTSGEYKVKARIEYENGSCDESDYISFNVERHSHQYELLYEFDHTCEDNVKGYYRCKLCGYPTIDYARPAEGHDWDSGVITKPASKTEVGVKTYTCKKCGEKKYEYINNTPQGWVDVFEPLCNSDGIRLCGWALDQDCSSESIMVDVYLDGVFYNSFYADKDRKDVNAYFGITGKHGFDIFINRKMSGTVNVQVYAINQNGGYNPQIGQQAVTISTVQHDYKFVKTIKAASCEEDGIDLYECKCGLTQNITTNKLGHSWDGGRIVREATSTVNGQKVYTCNRCQKTKEESIPATGQVEIDDGWPFIDVPNPYKGQEFWAQGCISYVYENGIIKGTGKDSKSGKVIFSPNDNLTRGQFVVMLHRLCGEPASSGRNVFPDVKEGKFYYNAVTWATENGIVNGYSNGCFGPDDFITREQLAVIFRNFMKYKNIWFGPSTDLNSYPDSGSVSGWSYESVSWAVRNGLISGKNINGTRYLAPKENATRAECAAMLQRCIEKMDYYSAYVYVYINEPKMRDCYTEIIIYPEGSNKQVILCSYGDN